MAPQFLGSFIFPRGCVAKAESLSAFSPYHGLWEKMRRSYTCYGVRVYGKWGHSRIYPALNTHGSSRRPRVPGGGAPAREAAAPSAGTLPHQPLFLRGRISIPPGDRLAQVWGVGVGECDAVGAVSPLASNTRYRRVAGETCLEQMTPTGDPGALTAGLWGGQAERPGLADQVRVQGKAPEQRPPQAPGLWGRDSKEPPSAPRPAEPAEAFGGRPLRFIVLENRVWAIFLPWKSWEHGGKR